jgi:hypothetical protein
MFAPGKEIERLFGCPDPLVLSMKRFEKGRIDVPPREELRRQGGGGENKKRGTLREAYRVHL